MGKHRDWSDIQAEYEKGASLQSLAEKHDISIGTIKKACARQGWCKKGSKLRKIEKSLDKIIPNGTVSGNGTEVVQWVPFQNRLENAAQTVLDKIEAAIEFVPPEQVQALKQITGALKDLCALTGGAKDDLDREEQRARIDKLRAETRTEDAASRTVTVRFVDTEGGED